MGCGHTAVSVHSIAHSVPGVGQGQENKGQKTDGSTPPPLPGHVSRIICLIGVSSPVLFFCFSFFFLFLGLNSWHMEVPRLGVESELQLPA